MEEKLSLRNSHLFVSSPQEARIHQLERNNAALRETKPFDLPEDMTLTSRQVITTLNDQNIQLLAQLKLKEKELHQVSEALGRENDELADRKSVV